LFAWPYNPNRPGRGLRAAFPAKRRAPPLPFPTTGRTASPFRFSNFRLDFFTCFSIPRTPPPADGLRRPKGVAHACAFPKLLKNATKGQRPGAAGPT